MTGLYAQQLQRLHNRRDNPFTMDLRPDRQRMDPNLGPMQTIEAEGSSLRSGAYSLAGEALGGGNENYQRGQNLVEASEFLPVVGGVAAAGDYADSVRAGDPIGMGIGAVGMGLSMIPGGKNIKGKLDEVGDAAKKAINDYKQESAMDGLRESANRQELVGKSKDRVGTTGQYVGAPAGVDTPEKLEELRENYIQKVIKGVDGADWYDDSSAYLYGAAPRNSGGNEPPQLAAQRATDTIAVTSQGTNVDTNLGFTVKAMNQRASGQPVETGRFPASQSPKIEQILDGEVPELGPKIGPFAENNQVSWNPELGTSPVNDIWNGRAFGYVGKDGKPWDAGFSPQQHAFMDEQTQIIVDTLNERKAGGRSDWNALNSQAAAWTGAKIDAGNINPEDAAMHYGDFGDKYAANATSEQIPGAGTGQLDGIVDQPYQVREDFTNDPRSTWDNEAGQDSMYSGAGMLTEPSNRNVGSYTPESTGVLEINPGSVARPLVQMEDVNKSKALSSRDEGILNTVETSRAFVDVQNGGAWHKIIPGAKAGEQSGLAIQMTSSPSESQMLAITKLAEDNGFIAVDTGQGVNFINDTYSDIGAARTGTSLGKELKKGQVLDADKNIVNEGPFVKSIQDILGADTKLDRVKIDSNYLSFDDAWRAGEGSGAATDQFIEEIQKNKTLRDSLEPVIRSKAAANMARDAEVSASTGMPIREDVQNARRILVEGGIEALMKARKAGAILPAVFVAVLAGTQVEDEPEQSGGLLMETS